MTKYYGREHQVWTDDMVRDYFDTHLNATLDEVCDLSGRSKADVKQVLMEG